MNKKKTLHFLVIIIGLFILLSSLIILSLGGWENTKLKATKYWGLVTIGNNPLLPFYDQDLQEINTSANEPRINLDELKAGGPPKDGIPSIDNPKFVGIEDTPYSDEELIIGVYYKGEARAYPYSILNWHEIVNDNFNGTNVVVTYCPLCDTNPVFIGEVNGTPTTFGVSGKLYHSCLVMYDRLTDSLWSQPWGIGVVGEQTNVELEKIVSHKTTLSDWKKKYPQTKVLSTDTGYSRDYFRYPYGTYYTDENLIFNARNQNLLEEHPKEIVSYIWDFDNDIVKNEFSGNAVKVVNDNIKNNGPKEFSYKEETITALWDEELNTVRFYYQNETEIPKSTAFAFVYVAYFK